MFKYFGFAESSTFFKICGEKLDNGFFLLCTALGTLFLTFGGAYAGGFDFLKEWDNVSSLKLKSQLIIFNPITSMGIGGLLLIYGTLGTYFDQNKQKQTNIKLEEENQRLQELKTALNSSQEDIQEYQSRIYKLHKELVATWLKGASKHLNLDHNERVTIYYEFEGEFYLLARYSKNPIFNKIHRQKFPLNKGVIGKAWQNEIHIEENAPSSDQYEEWLKYMSETYSYEVTKLKSLTMQSCRYIALAVIDADVHIGVIVFESINSNFINCHNDDDRENGTIQKYCRNRQSQLSQFVRDGIGFDREIDIRRNDNIKPSVEKDILTTFKKGAP